MCELGGGTFAAVASAVIATAHAADNPEAVFHRIAKTSDGVRIAMFRYAPPSAPQERPAVLLISDIGFNSRAFDLRERGLARYLAGHAIDTYSFDWRGTGVSDAPADFSLADLVERDLPAVVDGTGAARLVLVGWGIGGTAAIAYATHDADRIVGVVAINAPLDFDAPNAVVRRWLGQPSGSGLTSLPGGLDRSEDAPVFHLLFAHGNSLLPSETDRIRRETSGRIGARLKRDLLTWTKGQRPSFFGRELRDSGRSLERPVLLLLAPLDNWTHPEFAEAWADVLPHLTVQPLGWVDGYGEDYGHLGALFAKDSRHRAWARIGEFVEGPAKSR